jgi:hypothetical protein
MIDDKPLATFLHLQLQGGTTQWVTIPEVASGNYIIYSKYQSDLPKLYDCVVLCYLMQCRCR